MTTTADATTAPLPPEHRPDAIKRLLAEEHLLDARLAELDPVPLLLVYTHLSGDESLLEKFRPHIKGAWAFEVEAPDDLKAELRARTIAVFKDYAASGRPLPARPTWTACSAWPMSPWASRCRRPTCRWCWRN